MYVEQNNRTISMAKVRDLSLRVYNERQLNEITEDRINYAATKILPAGKFTYNARGWQPNEYKGYAIVSMLNNNPGNESLTDLLIDIQEELQQNLQPLYGFYMLPADSFHQTIANTLSADGYKENILHAGLDELYPDMVASAFTKIFMMKQLSPIRMRIVGLSIMGTAICALGTFEIDADYNRIVNFRAGFYEDKQLADLDIKMTRPFIGHITLGYIEHKFNINQKVHLANILNELNDQLFLKRHYFNISHTELRGYDHLAEFKTAADFPVYKFTL